MMTDWYLKSMVASLTEGIVIKAAGTRLDSGHAHPFFLGGFQVKIKSALAKVAFLVLTGNDGSNAYPTADTEVQQLIWSGDCPFGAADQDLNEILIVLPRPLLIGEKNAAGKVNYLWGKVSVDDNVCIIPYEAFPKRASY